MWPIEMLSQQRIHVSVWMIAEFRVCVFISALDCVSMDEFS